MCFGINKTSLSNQHIRVESIVQVAACNSPTLGCFYKTSTHKTSNIQQSTHKIAMLRNVFATISTYKVSALKNVYATNVKSQNVGICYQLLLIKCLFPKLYLLNKETSSLKNIHATKCICTKFQFFKTSVHSELNLKTHCFYSTISNPQNPTHYSRWVQTQKKD